ncbi:MAG: DHH family protein [Candidatus Uhrbacteria bacterium]
MTIVTAGKSFNDIDAFACAIAYAELLRLEGTDARAVFVGPLNHSVTALALEQGGEFATKCVPADGDRFVFVDLSGPDHFAFAPVDESKIAEIYDHHYGFENHWKERLGDRSHIERVGAAATLIWEEVERRGFADRLSAASVNLLAIATLQNTLNFTSSETVDRDRRAFDELSRRVTMAEGWQDRYFAECAEAIHGNLAEAIANDTKTLDGYFGDRALVFSQLEITENPAAFLRDNRVAIDAHWESAPTARHLINLADIRSRSSLLYSDDSAWLSETIAPLFSERVAVDERAFTTAIVQRKQVLSRLQTKSRIA